MWGFLREIHGGISRSILDSLNKLMEQFLKVFLMIFCLISEEISGRNPKEITEENFKINPWMIWKREWKDSLRNLRSILQKLPKEHLKFMMKILENFLNKTLEGICGWFFNLWISEEIRQEILEAIYAKCSKGIIFEISGGLFYGIRLVWEIPKAIT